VDNYRSTRCAPKLSVVSKTLRPALTFPAHTYFGQLRDSDGTVLLCLHEWGAHEHPSLTSPDAGTPGNGLLLFFRVDDFGAALRRARKLVPQLAEEPHVNSATGTKEFALLDPDGYYVMVSALSEEELQALTKRRRLGSS
jgi:catechol 2,3-dioxygenase-like lactoylglutathione lyase family enzyme